VPSVPSDTVKITLFEPKQNHHPVILSLSEECQTRTRRYKHFKNNYLCKCESYLLADISGLSHKFVRDLAQMSWIMAEKDVLLDVKKERA
ncbi:hypothetical protein, partial [Photobacterium marinum]|uniref:hypothetical protein n=1 Tax=Photobacterium marinum TaxID=1056511 RepID=UPI00056C9C89